MIYQPILKKKSDVKRYIIVKFMELEKVLYEGFTQYQERVNMSKN
jgi:hypothetical protein